VIVDIDEAQLDRELDALLAGLPADGLEGEYIQAGPSQWEQALREFKVFEKAHEGLAPAWDISDETKNELTVASGQLLDRHFPGALEGMDRWGPWARVGYIVTMIAFANFDFEHMRFKPTRAPEPEKPPAATPEQKTEGEGNDGDPE